MKPNDNSAPHLATSLPHLLDFARHRNQCVTVFDLETTTCIPNSKWLGITEVALLAISPSGEIESVSALVNPERRIPKAVSVEERETVVRCVQF